MTKKKRLLSVLSVVIVLCVALSLFLLPKNNSKNANETPDIEQLYQKLVYKKNENNYDSFIAQHEDLAPLPEEIKLSVGKKYRVGESFSADFKSVKGLFEIELEYRAAGESLTEPEISVSVNGKEPYPEAGGISLPLWYESKTPEADERGNQYTPELSVSERSTVTRLYDSTGYHSGPLCFASEDGKNTVSISFDNGEAELISVTLLPAGSSDITAGDTAGEGTGKSFRVQGEYPLYRSDTSILEFCDRVSPVTDPSFDGLQVWNSLGGNGWSRIGQRVEWRLDVPESGWYSLSVRYRQNYLSGRTSHRRLTIDGKLPDGDFADLKFAYGKDWQLMTPASEDGKALKVYLEKGKHILSLEVTLGEDAQIVNLSQQALYELNSVYRKFIMQTGANPDKYRDYQIEKKMPDVLRVLKSEKEILEGIYSLLYGQSSGEDSASITKLIWQLKEFIKDPESIPASMSVFQSNITAFGAWLQEKTSQPLCVDYFEFTPEGKNAEFSKGSFFTKLLFAAKQFARSFADEYGVIGSVYDSDEAMNVWMVGGRDQYQILKGQIDNGFTAETGVSANLKLVVGGLLESISAGIAPDVYLFGSEMDPVNFASRGALVDLSKFPDYKEISNQFASEAVVPFEYMGGVYALPVTQTFLMMYVREDIFSELGFSVPKTWNEIYALLSFLQQNNMEFGFPVPSNANIYGFALILFQKQQQLYRDGGKTVMFDTEEALNAFDNWTKLYTDYSCIVDYNFVNRFRIGDMPIGIADFTVYNTLQVSAPEINGMWNMYQIPSADEGESCGYSVSTVNSAFILEQSKNKENAWKFLKWFAGEEEQYAYASAIENMQGISGRFSTANLAAFNRIPFRKSTLEQINAQRAKAIGVEQVPGGYFLSRHIDNIYRAVKNNGDDVRQTALEYTDTINAELTRKRKEFGLETAE